MTLQLETRQVPREVRVYVCDKCKVEAVGDPAVVGWVAAGTFELRPPNPFTSKDGLPVVTIRMDNERHLCTRCSPLLEVFVNKSTPPGVSVQQLADAISYLLPYAEAFKPTHASFAAEHQRRLVDLQSLLIKARCP